MDLRTSESPTFVRNESGCPTEAVISAEKRNSREKKRI